MKIDTKTKLANLFVPVSPSKFKSLGLIGFDKTYLEIERMDIERYKKLNSSLILEDKIEGVGQIYLTSCPTTKLSNVQGEILSARDLVYAAISRGFNSSLMKLSSGVKEGIIYTSDKNRPILVSDTHRLDKKTLSKFKEDYSIDQKFVRSYLELAEEDKNKDLMDKGALTIKIDYDKNCGNFDIPTNRFGEEELTLWSLKDQAKEYGYFLRENGVKNLRIDFYNSKGRLMFSPMRIGGRDGRLGGGSSYGFLRVSKYSSAASFCTPLEFEEEFFDDDIQYPTLRILRREIK